MSAIFKGRAATLFSDGVQYDPDRGTSEVYRLRGTKAHVRATAGGWKRFYPDARISTRQIEGPVYELALELPYWINDPGNPYTQRWSTSTELVEKDLFSHPNASLAVTASGLSAAKFRERMEDGIEKGKDFDDVGVDPSGNNTNAQNMYLDLARGITGWETEYQTVTRFRSANVRTPWNRVVYSTKYIYTTSQLGIPSSIGYSFESYISTQTNMLWGWRLRDQDFSEENGERQETITWALAEWSLNLYEQEPTGGSFA